MRYVLLLILNLPLVVLAVVNALTLYKLKKISPRKFRLQFIFWIVILLVLIGSFPIYNQLSGRDPFESANLSAFDIVQTTAIILLIYVVNNQRQKVELIEKRTRDLHQELSIRLAASHEEAKR